MLSSHMVSKLCNILSALVEWFRAGVMIFYCLLDLLYQFTSGVSWQMFYLFCMVVSAGGVVYSAWQKIVVLFILLIGNCHFNLSCTYLHVFLKFSVDALYLCSILFIVILLTFVASNCMAACLQRWCLETLHKQ